MTHPFSSLSAFEEAYALLENAALCLTQAAGIADCVIFYLAEGEAPFLRPALSFGPRWAGRAEGPGEIALDAEAASLFLLEGGTRSLVEAELPLGSVGRALLARLRAPSALLFPLSLGPTDDRASLVGIGILLGPDGRPFSPRVVSLCQAHGGLMGALIERTNRLRQRERELDALYDLTMAAMETTCMDELLRRALSSILESTDLGSGLLAYRPEAGPRLLHCHRGLRQGLVDALAEFESRQGLGVLYRCLTGEALAPKLRGEAGALVERCRESLSSWVVMPLQRNGALRGLLFLGSAEYEQISDQVSKLLSTVTNQLILAIERAIAYGNMEEEVERRTGELRVSRDRLEATVDELKRMDQYKSDFLSNVSHELRTPLSGVIGYGEFLTEGVYGELNDEQARILDQLIKSSYQLMELINNLLDLSRIDAGQLQLYAEVIEVSALIEQAVVQVTPQALQKRIRLTLPEPPLAVVEADPGRIVQVLVNLLANAIKFTPEDGEVAVAVLQEGDTVTVAVHDTGIGIAPEHMPRLFQRFSQADSSTTRRFGGTGLGLAISRELVSLHGQRIWVDSTPGAGSTFSFTLAAWSGVGERLVAPAPVA